MRNATKKEKHEMELAFRREIKLTKSELPDGSIRFAGIINDYMTDCPGYCGKVGVVAWGGAPGFIDSFIWIKGRCKHATESRR